MTLGKLGGAARELGLFVKANGPESWRVGVPGGEIVAHYNPRTLTLEMDGIRSTVSGWLSMLRTVAIEIKKRGTN